jgi:hypothetical protein
MTEDPVPRSQPPKPPSNPFADDDDAPSRRRRPRRDDDDYDDDDYSGRRSSPHRGDTVLVLGILSIVLGLGVGTILGIIALNMANTDLSLMASGRMDRSGRGSTQAGKTCATVGLILHCIGLVCCCGYFAIMMGAVGAGGIR